MTSLLRIRSTSPLALDDVNRSNDHHEAPQPRATSGSRDPRDPADLLLAPSDVNIDDSPLAVDDVDGSNDAPLLGA